MIIIGFPGVGKSTLSRGVGGKYIDLESSLFSINNKKIDKWEIPYVRVAEYLSRKGFDVFVSSHPEVADALSMSSEFVFMCFPSIELKDAWIDRLKNRYAVSHLTKDKNAMRHISMCYEKDIEAMIKTADKYKFESVILKSMDYDLKQELEGIISK